MSEFFKSFDSGEDSARREREKSQAEFNRANPAKIKERIHARLAELNNSGVRLDNEELEEARMLERQLGALGE